MIYPSKNLCYPVLDPNLSKGLVGYWPLDNQGGIAYDRSGYGNNGTLVADTHSVISERGRCLSFDGDGDYVSVANSTLYDFTSEDYSVSFWINTQSLKTTGTEKLIDKATWNVSGWEIFISYAAVYHRLYARTYQSGAIQTSYSYTDLVINTWYHVTICRRGSAIDMYINAVNRTQSAGSHIDPASSSDLLAIGASDTGASPFLGLLSDVAIFNRDLLVSEVQELYRYGLHKHRDPIELWTAASPTSGTIIPLIQYYNQQARA